MMRLDNGDASNTSRNICSRFVRIACMLAFMTNARIPLSTRVNVDLVHAVPKRLYLINARSNLNAKRKNGHGWPK